MAQTRPAHVRYFRLLGFSILWLLVTSSANGQGSAFSYQGKLTDAGNPANGTYDLQFKLFDTPTVGTGTQAGATITNPTVQVTAGIFTVTLDFGSNVFTGAARFLEIGVRPAGSADSYTVLSPRQPITSSPYAIQTINAQQLGGLPASRFVQFDGSGNTGIGTNSPASKLDVRGNLVLDPGGNPGLFTAAGGGEQSRYLELLNSPSFQSASGLKAGGILVSGDFGFANPAKNDLIVKGNVGIGTASPTAKLTINGAGAFNSSSASRFDLFNTTANAGFLQHVTDTGLLQFATTSGNTRMVIDPNGNVGIGTTSPSAKLTVSGSGIFNTPGAARFDLFNTTAGTGFFQHVGDSGLLQFTTTGGLTRMVIDPNGNVGVGTVTPSAKLQIAGVGTNGYTLGVEGNVTQNLANFGFAKAMLAVNKDGSIARCFNSTISGIGATAVPCGFIVGLNGSAGFENYGINFGFQVDNRFLAITPEVSNTTGNVAANYAIFGATSIIVYIDLTNTQFNQTTANFTIIVY